MAGSNSKPYTDPLVYVWARTGPQTSATQARTSLSIRRQFLSARAQGGVAMSNLDDRAEKAGLSLLQIARRTGIHAWRLYGAYELNEDERARLDAVLVEAERK